ncbi:two-component system osmolarity sensor histidine kinase EnvZ [Rhizomicrobium palustre]|uniref:histidine kinase n=1 Tax=Rhizomicrobium palustre TaxID=189966 RepID=A0A846MXJ3_9PROT|nr:ATP-binding protein [Rhizomicrobium palustre]NIK87740.1 two-component system osmolarity sensor histidine kinase EnvZ [Rhizomicrobium palustre]
MSSYPTASVKAERGFRPGRFVKRFLPRGLFGRSLIIIVAPMVILQAIVSYVFFERDLDTTTRRMAKAAAADITLLVALEDTRKSPWRENLRELAAKQLRYDLRFEPGVHIPPPTRQHKSTIDKALDETIAQQIGEKRHFRTAPLPGKKFIAIDVEVHDGVLHAIVPRDRITVSSPDIFIVWMLGSSLILLAVAILFLRNQVRPIERLARAADAFGKGRAVPDFKPYGATEVRRAAQAFLTMRDRIERHVHQRTAMLAGVSHDLKTPLTRIRLQLAMMDETADTKALGEDIAEMERMLDDYLDFARGEGGEKSQRVDLSQLLRDAAIAAEKARPGPLELNVPEGVLLSVKPRALRRCVTNLIENALKYGRSASVSLDLEASFAQIHVDDEGKGIAPELREEAFRPFHRLDEGRNLQSGGVGLGLAIARDIARAHGGDLTLSDSPKGGLRATVRLPL